MELFSAEVLIETFYVVVNWVFRCSLTSCFSDSFWNFLHSCNVKTVLVRCETVFVFCFLREKWIINYRLLHRHRCRRGKRSGRLHCAGMELLSLLRFCFPDVFMTSCFYIAFWQMVYCKPRFFCFWTVYMGLSCISPWTCVCFLFPSKNVKKRLSIAAETPMQTGNMEWPIAVCGYGAPLFVGIQFFEVSASSADCARHIAIYGSRAQLSVISNSSSILVTLCFRRFWFRRYSRVTLTCYSFDILGVLHLIMFWYFKSLSHFFGVGG